MEGRDDGESRTHEPTPKRLEDARKKGEIPRSADLNTAIAYGGILLALAAAGPQMVGRLGGTGTTLLSQADLFATGLVHEHGAATARAIMTATGRALAPLLALPGLLVLGWLVARRSLLFTPSKVAPKLSRLSLVSNAKQKFGLAGLVEFFKSFLKLVVFSAALALYLWAVADRLILSVTLEPAQAVSLLGRLALEFLAIVVAIALVIGIGDAIWQDVNFRRRNRMTHKEVRDETKEQEGDPALKQRRRQKAISIAQDSMIADVARANVVIVNPEHYAVALEWDAARHAAPVCLAKGVDEIAARIREAAAEADVPLHRDPPTARALHATVELGEQIPREHYHKVAAAIRFAEAVRRKARSSIL